MGLIQTPDQLKFSYLAIVEGAKEMGLLPKDFLSDLVRPPTIELRTSDSSSSSSDDDAENDDGNAPPLPPRRSDSLVKSNLYNNGLDSFAKLPDFLQGSKY